MEDKRDLENKRNSNWNIKPYLAVGLTAFIVIALSISLYFLIYRFEGLTAFGDKLVSVLKPIILGFAFAYLLSPVVNFFEKYLMMFLEKHIKNGKRIKKLSRILGVAATLICTIIFIGVLLNMVIPELYRSIENLVVTLPKQIESFVEWFTDYTKSDNVYTEYIELGLLTATEFFENWAKTEFLPQTKNIVTLLTTGIINVVRALFNVVIGAIISIYLLSSKETFIGQSKKIVYSILKPKGANVLIETVRKSHQIFGGFITGKLLDSLIIGIICFIVLYILSIPYAVLVSVIVGVTNVIPFFGPYIGAIPSAILIILVNPLQGLYFIIFILILQQVDGNIIGPAILGETTGLSSFWIIFAILVGGGLFGFLGMVMGVPTCGVIYYIVKKIVEYVLSRRKLPTETTEYTHLKHVDLATNQIVYLDMEFNKNKTKKKQKVEADEEIDNKK